MGRIDFGNRPTTGKIDVHSVRRDMMIAGVDRDILDASLLFVLGNFEERLDCFGKGMKQSNN